MIIDLATIQYGTPETSWGTSKAATYKPMGVESCKVNPGVKTRLIKEMRGSMQHGFKSYVYEVSPSGQITLALNSEGAPYWFDNFFGTATPTGTGPYTYAYVGGTSNPPVSPRFLTLFYGNIASAAAAYEINKLLGTMATKITIKGKSNDHARITVDYLGKQVIAGTLAVLSDSAYTPCTPDILTIYKDAWSGTVGTTALSAVAYDYTIVLSNGRKLDQHADSIVAPAYIEGPFSVDSFELNASLASATSGLLADQLVAAPTVSQYQFRFKWDNAGATTAQRQCQFDVAATLEQTAPIYDDLNGLVKVSWKGYGEYNSGAFANSFKAQFINNTSALI